MSDHGRKLLERSGTVAGRHLDKGSDPRARRNADDTAGDLIGHADRHLL